MEVDGPGAVLSGGCQSETEQSVGPLEVDAADVVVAGQRVHVEVVVLGAEGLVALEVVDDEGVATQVRHVRERFVALVTVHVHDDVREERVLLDERLVEQVLVHQLQQSHHSLESHCIAYYVVLHTCSIEEVKKGNKGTKSCKTPGEDGITFRVIKAGSKTIEEQSKYTN